MVEVAYHMQEDWRGMYSWGIVEGRYCGRVSIKSKMIPWYILVSIAKVKFRGRRFAAGGM